MVLTLGTEFPFFGGRAKHACTESVLIACLSLQFAFRTLPLPSALTARLCIDQLSLIFSEDCGFLDGASRT